MKMVPVRKSAVGISLSSRMADCASFATRAVICIAVLEKAPKASSRKAVKTQRRIEIKTVMGLESEDLVIC